MQRSDFNDLTFENIGIWPMPAKVIVIGLCCAVIAFLFLFFLIRPELNRYSAAQGEETVLLGSYTMKAQEAANLEVYQKQLVMIKKVLAAVLQKLPNSSEIPNLIEDISKMGIASGLEFNLIKPDPEVDKGFYVELPIKLSVTGNYPQLANFVSGVENLQRIITFDNFKITRADQVKNTTGTPDKKPMKADDLLMEVTAKTYRYTGGEQNPGGAQT